MKKNTRQISVGKTAVGGGAAVSVQSMCNTKTSDVDATVSQIKRLEANACEIVRVAVPDEESARAIKDIKAKISIPLIADIHFRHDLALISIDSGADAIRINPGNIGDRAKVAAVVEAARARRLPIRIGVNSGSVEKHLLEKYGHPTPEAMVESALAHVRILEEMNYREVKISVKASGVGETIAAYRLLSQKTDLPLHLGVTEAGTLLSGAIKSAMGIGTLLAEGIGDTIRVSLTSDVVNEVRAAYEILANLNLRKRPYPEIISCPTCGRLGIDLEALVSRVERHLEGVRIPMKVAVMGCVVNGPGEASEADVGVAGGDGRGVIFRSGKVVKTCDAAQLEKEFLGELDKLISEKS